MRLMSHLATYVNSNTNSHEESLTNATFPLSLCLLQDDSSVDFSRRMLRRETAIELPRSPFKSATTVTTVMTETHRINKSADQPAGAQDTSPVQQNYLLPSMSEPNNTNYFKKSFESLQKNSSTDTEYSVQPYKVVKQSSNETSTSLTGSFNVEQASTGGAMCIESTLEHSLDASDSIMNQTVIENREYDATKNGNGPRNGSDHDEDQTSAPSHTSDSSPVVPAGPPRPLKKQFSVDHSMKLTVEHGGQHFLAAVQEGLAPPLLTKSATPCASPLSRGFQYLRESSSTSTEEFKEEPGQGSTTSGTTASGETTANDSKQDEENGADSHFGETFC